MRSAGPRVLTALTAILVLAVAATALALTPKPGQYTNGDNQHNITFAVDDGDIIQFVSSSSDCDDGKPAIIEKINVKSSGRFHYEGKATGQLAGDHWHAEVKGKFVSKKKAKGTFEREDCDEEGFKAKRQ